jgi:DNA polymerase-1
MREWIGKTLREAYEKGYVTTMAGFKRYVLELRSNNQTIRKFGERIAVNSPIQGSAADIIKAAMVEIDKELQEKGLSTKMILQVHDELVFETPEKEVQKVAPVVKKLMETTMGLSVPLIVELKMGKDWGNMKSFKV